MLQSGISTRENFHDRLTCWYQSNDGGRRRTRLDPMQAGGAAWTDTGPLPEPFRREIRDATDNWMQINGGEKPFLFHRRAACRGASESAASA